MRKQILPKLILSLSIIAIIASLGFRIYVFNKYSTTGDELRGYEMEIQKLNKENELLKQRAANDSSLLTIKSKASLLGMMDPVSSEFLTPVPSAAVISVDDSSNF